MEITETRLQEVTAAFEACAKMRWGELVAESSEVILFGSWALGKEDPHSDLDLLCVDFPRRIKSPKLDLLVYPRVFLNTREWLESELAVHVAHYGVMLKGEGTWRALTRITPITIARKKEQVLIRAVRLSCSLQSRSRARTLELVKLRRDLQRLVSLVQKKPTPPTVLLDEQWKSDPAIREKCRHQLSEAGRGITEALLPLEADIFAKAASPR